MRKWISFPKSEGLTSKQAHTDLPAGTYERELGREGFFGPATQMYHRHPPTHWTNVDGPLRPHAFDTTKLEAAVATPWAAAALAGNAAVRMSLWLCAQPMHHLVRNADGDDLLFVHSGAGDLFCDYGHISVGEGDYVLLPRGTMWRIEPSSPMRVLMIEAVNSAYQLPEKGLVGNHAIFDPAVLRAPSIDDAFRAQQTETPTDVEVKRHGAITRISYPFNPLDAVGWHGDLTVVALNWRDIRPLMSHRYHLPPSAHTTFVANRFVVCTFCPRPIESDPGALKIPFFHNNDDYDEVIFYHRGQFFSRDNIHPGMMTLHPCGISHGPHPKAFATGAQGARKETDEVAVMVDTRDGLAIFDGAQSVEWPGYVDSWKGAVK